MCRRRAAYIVSWHDDYGYETDCEPVCRYHFAKMRDYFMNLPNCTITRAGTGEVLFTNA